MQKEILNGMKHYVFADTENWASNISLFVDFLTENSYLSKYAQIVCFIGSDKSQKNYFEKLKEKICTDKSMNLTPIKTDSKRRNAVDMVLCAYLGMAVEKSPSAEFVVVSNDRDYSPSINKFKTLGVNIREEKNPGKSKKSKPQNVQQKLSDDKIKELSEKIYCQKSSRPTKITTLRKRVNQFKKKYHFLEKDLDSVLQKVKEYLVKAKKISIENNIIKWK